MSNSDGSSRAASTLTAYLSGGRLPHAILVEGHCGTIGFAKKIAKAALCPAESGKPCGVCVSCVKIEKDIHPDVTVHTGGGSANSFHVDRVRDIRQEAYIKPNEADGRVFILENAQTMTIQAQNALLKIIEDPPRAVTFILTCENRASLLETIRSRVSVFALDDMPDEADSELFRRAKSALDELLSGSELAALASFAPYERDRAGFAAFLRAMRDEAAKEAVALAKDEVHTGKTRARRLQLLRLVAILDEIDAGIRQNVGGLLLASIAPAKFKL